MSFNPQCILTQHMLRQIIAIERTRGFMKAVRLKDDWIAKTRQAIRIEDALASVQIEGSSLTMERAFEVARNLPFSPYRPDVFLVRSATFRYTARRA